MHAGGAVVVNLDAIHADIAFAGVGIFGDDAGQGDEAAAVERPAFEDGQVEERVRVERLVGRALERSDNDQAQAARARFA